METVTEEPRGRETSPPRGSDPRAAIPVRRPDLALSPSVPRHWNGGRPFATHFFDALSSTFPDGEASFVRSVQHFRGRIEDPDLARAVQQLERARATLAAAELRWTDQHPDIQRLKRDIAELEKKAEAEALQAPLSAGGGLPPAEAARQKRMADLRAEVAQITKDIEAFTKEEARLRGIAAQYQRRVEMAPTRENELTELTRDYGVLQGLYSGLLEKVESARLATNLERGQKGETFRLLDPARVPERPYSPDRQRLIQMGMGAGLGIGALLVLLLEFRDRGFRSDDDVKQVLDVPVLAVVPLMRSERERRRFRTMKWAMHLVLGSVVLVCLSVLGYAGFNFGF
jgi:hypothetical protein